jgi:hypothetical protein
MKQRNQQLDDSLFDLDFEEIEPQQMNFGEQEIIDLFYSFKE